MDGSGGDQLPQAVTPDKPAELDPFLERSRLKVLHEVPDEGLLLGRLGGRHACDESEDQAQHAAHLTSSRPLATNRS